nr:MAG TPA: Ataxin-3 [Caudoviricetes sp.]
MIQIDIKKSAETTLDGEYSTVMGELTSAIRDIRKKYPEEASDEDFEKAIKLSKMNSEELVAEAANILVENILRDVIKDITGEENE